MLLGILNTDASRHAAELTISWLSHTIILLLLLLLGLYRFHPPPRGSTVNTYSRTHTVVDGTGAGAAAAGSGMGLVFRVRVCIGPRIGFKNKSVHLRNYSLKWT